MQLLCKYSPLFRTLDFDGSKKVETDTKKVAAKPEACKQHKNASRGLKI
jgi:hypothetical protein